MQNWTRFPRVILALSLLIVLCAGLFAPRVDEARALPLLACPGGIITEWTFSNVTTPTIGSGNFTNGTGITPSFAADAAGNVLSAISFTGWAATFDPNDYVEFSADTTLNTDISISFDYRSTGAGPSNLDLQYSADGISFTSYTITALNRDSTFHNLFFDLSSILVINNNANTKFRVYGYGASGGNLRLDNLAISEACPTDTPTTTSTSTTTSTVTDTPTITNTPTITTTPTITLTPTITNTPTTTGTSTTTPTRTVTSTLVATGPLSVLINEVGWAGTSSTRTIDEWIELYNTGSADINLDGWELMISDGNTESLLVAFEAGDIIRANKFFILARENSSGNYDIFNNVNEDKPFTGELRNTGTIILRLYNSQGTQIDTANSGKSSGWYAGKSTASPAYSSMERRGKTFADGPSAWFTFGGTPVARNRDNAFVRGTPGGINWAFGVTPTRVPVRTATRTPIPTNTPIPTYIPPDPRPIINEILPRPGFDWNKDGKVDVFDEFVEIKNLTSINISLKGWRLDDELNFGSDPFTLPDVTLKPGQRVVFYALETNILLSDGGDTVRLISPNGKIYDAYTYSIAKVEDQSICRLPDGNVYNGWFEDCIPTPNLNNSREGAAPSMPDVEYESPVCKLPDTLPADFLFAECRGYGADIWDADFWDQPKTSTARYIPQNTSKWEAIIE